MHFFRLRLIDGHVPYPSLAVPTLSPEGTKVHLTNPNSHVSTMVVNVIGPEAPAALVVLPRLVAAEHVPSGDENLAVVPNLPGGVLKRLQAAVLSALESQQRSCIYRK